MAPSSLFSLLVGKSSIRAPQDEFKSDGMLEVCPRTASGPKGRRRRRRNFSKIYEVEVAGCRVIAKSMTVNLWRGLLASLGICRIPTFVGYLGAISRVTSVTMGRRGRLQDDELNQICTRNWKKEGRKTLILRF